VGVVTTSAWTDLAHVLPGNATHDVLEPLRERQEWVQVFGHEVVGCHDADATLHGLVQDVLTNHVVALDVDHVRLHLIEQQADFLLDFPWEANTEVLVRKDAVGAKAVDRGFVAELRVALALVLPAGQHVYVVSSCRHSLGQAVAELGGAVDVRWIGVCRDQDGEGFAGVGNGHVENS